VLSIKNDETLTGCGGFSCGVPPLRPIKNVPPSIKARSGLKVVGCSVGVFGLTTIGWGRKMKYAPVPTPAIPMMITDATRSSTVLVFLGGGSVTMVGANRGSGPG